MNEPRFIVSETSGMPIGRNGGWTIQYLILDRAYCHRVVARHGTSADLRSGPLRGHMTRAWARTHAEREAARLNAEHEAWMAAA